MHLNMHAMSPHPDIIPVQSIMIESILDSHRRIHLKLSSKLRAAPSPGLMQTTVSGLQKKDFASCQTLAEGLQTARC